MLQQPSSIDQLEECLNRFKQMRASQPVSYDEARQTWHLVCYQEVMQVLADTNRYVLPGTVEADFPTTSSTGSLFPRIAQRLLSQVLTPRSVGELTPQVREITHSLLGQIRQAGTIDLIEDFAAPLSSSVLAELLGIPLEQRIAFMELAKTQRKDPAGGQIEGISLLFSKLIAQRREQPQNDLISTLLTTSVDTSLANEADITVCLAWLMGMGYAMVTHLLGNAVLCLLLHPEVIERLHQDPAPIYSTIEEALRYLPPVWRVTRMTAEEVALGGQPIPARARICAWIVSANRDESRFSSPDTFDIERVPNRHLSFGYGKGYHFDTALARLLAEVSLTLLLGYLPGLQLLPGQRLETIDNPAIFGVKHLYVTVSPTSVSV